MALDNIHSQLQEMRDRMELKEKWNEKMSIKGLGEFRKAYETLKKSGVDKRFVASIMPLVGSPYPGPIYLSYTITSDLSRILH